MNASICGLSSDKAREIVAGGGNVVVDFAAKSVTITHKGDTKVVAVDANSEPQWSWNVESVVQELEAPKPVKSGEAAK